MRFSSLITSQTGKVFLFAFSSFWMFLEFGERYQLVDVNVPELIVGTGVLGLSLFIALVSAFLIEKKQQNRQIENLWKQMSARSVALRQTYEALMAEKSYFKLLFLDWRLQSELEKSRITSGGFILLPAKKAFDYTIYVFSSLMNRLQTTDSYMTISNLKFWSRVRFGEGHFLNENLRASDRGVVIRRIIIINEETLLLRNASPEWEELCSFVGRLYQFYGSNPRPFQGIEWLFFVSNNYEIDCCAPVPYAVLTNAPFNEHMALLPVIAQNENEESQIKVYFSAQKDDLEINRLIDRYDGLYRQRSRHFDIQSFYEILFQPVLLTQSKN